MARSNISNSADILDSRDIEERINELEYEVSDLRDEIEEKENKLVELQAVESEEAEDKRSDLKEQIAEKKDEISELQDELKPMLEFRESVGHPEWKHGLTIISESYWEYYARELAEDLYGKELRDSTWPFSHIDWEDAAKTLLMDYSSAEYDGTTFYFMS